MADNPDLNKELDAKLERARQSTADPVAERMRRRRAGLSTNPEAMLDELPAREKLKIIDSGW
jgi:hypothetical protein